MTDHGDDIYRYDDIRINFSSNIYAHADLSRVNAHIMSQIGAIASYPEPEPKRLEKLIAQSEGTDEECVIVGNGATEIIYLTAMMMRGTTFKVHNPTFSEYERACRLHGSVAVEDGCGESGSPALEWICNPNNPDGRVWERESLLKHIDENTDTLFVVDASYEDYTLAILPSTDDFLQRNNVISLHSMTKRYCIPGLRLGYAIGKAEIIRRMKALRQPWSVNSLAQKTGEYLMQQAQYQRTTASCGGQHAPSFMLPPMDEYMAEARRLASAINSIEGFTADIHDTHFFLCTTQGNASLLKERLATEHGILIRDASTFTSLSSHHFRIAAQTHDENDVLVSVLCNFS